MSDLISRQAAIDAVKRLSLGETDAKRLAMRIEDYLERLQSAQPEPIKINIEDFNKEDWERLKKEWENTPITVLPVQPEIIRCKDCKNSEHWYRDRRRCFLWSEDGVSVFDDGFCSYAERRTDG